MSLLGENLPVNALSGKYGLRYDRSKVTGNTAGSLYFT